MVTGRQGHFVKIKKSKKNQQGNMGLSDMQHWHKNIATHDMFFS